MFDASIEVRKGSKQPGFSKVAVATGTVTIQSGGTFQLLYPDYTPVLSPPASQTFVTPVAVTGFDNTAGLSERIWYNLDVSGLQTSSYYIGQFVYSVLGSDGMTRVKVSEIQIVVVA